MPNFANVYDYSIIGGGLAGCTLAYRLIKQGAKVMVFDSPQHNVSSKVAAGVFNPITGKRMALTWRAKEMFDELHAFYPEIENETGTHFFHQFPFYKLFDTVFEQNEWLNKTRDTEVCNFIDFEVKTLDSSRVNNPFGALQIHQAGRLNSKVFIESMHHWLMGKNALKSAYIDFLNPVIGMDSVKIDTIQSHAIVFCDGSQAKANPYFNYLPHKPVHGELIEVDIPDFYTDRIINKGVFVLPIRSTNYLVGATYNWNLDEPIPTAKGKLELENKIREIIKKDFKTINHHAGIRPSTLDRRPYLGIHPKHKNLYIFGGFGSKGVSLIPYLSYVFANYLLKGSDLPTEVDIKRVRRKTD